MKLGQVRNGSPAITTALADARSARNRSTRDSRSAVAEDRASARRYKRARAEEDRERAHAMNRRIRVQVPESDRPKTQRRTPRRLFYRLSGKAMSSRLVIANAVSGGTRSIHFAVTARGFGSKTGRAWRDGEGERAAQYITREDALEGGEAGWWSNIAQNRTELVAFHRASEAIEKHDRANANVYVSEIIALPASLIASERCTVVRDYCRYFDERGIAYTVGMHKPDPAGDVRNFHCHIVYSLRPATRHDAYDWSFAVSKLPDVNTPEGIATRRKLATDAINVTLTAAGSGQRYTHLSNRARGLGTPAPKQGQRQTWVSRRLAAAQVRCDELGVMRERVAVLRKSLAVIVKAHGMRDLAIDRLGSARDLLRSRLMANDDRLARCRNVVAARVGDADGPERTRTRSQPIEAAKPVLADKLRAAAAKIQWPMLLDQQLAAVRARIVARQRRRKALEEAAVRAAEPLPDLMSASDGVLNRLVADWQRITVDRQQQDIAVAALREQALLRLDQANAPIDPSANDRLARAGERIAERHRLDMMLMRLTNAMASLPDLVGPKSAVADRLTAAAMRQPAAVAGSREMLARSVPTISLLPGSSPPAASSAGSGGAGPGAVRDPAGEPRGERKAAPVRDDAARSASAATWSEPERRCKSEPAHEPDTPRRINPTPVTHADIRSEETKNDTDSSGVTAQQPAPAIGNPGDIIGERNQRRLPPRLSKGPDDVTGAPPGGGRDGPGR